MTLPLSIRALIVDDEKPARDRMAGLLSEFDDIDVVGEAEDGDSALAAIALERPDLVFLDIQMPGKSGLEVASLVGPPRPRFIYCTAYDRYAVQAFESNAVDYLLKPVTRRRLGTAIDRVRLSLEETAALAMSGELKRAEETQAKLFPRLLPHLRPLEYDGLCQPCEAIGGDYYDFIDLGSGRLGVALADVSGKGISAALLMAGLQGRLQSYAPDFGDRLEEMVARLNQALCLTTEASRFVTFFYGVYDDASRRFRYVNAGHNPPLVLRSEGKRVVRLEQGGTVLGILPEAVYRSGEVEVGPGDILMLFTDGLTESFGPLGEEFGDQRLVDLAGRNGGSPLGLIAAAMRTAEEFRGGRAPHDDLTIVVARGR
jgi:serine phosphatase RsbU (regulator of sigma subunit)